ncbi:MAG TPA: cytochrome-c peroxidase [Labilithrix sp.]|nr:cytochrome-c peroxidase [Labilithrix sp.]
MNRRNVALVVGLGVLAGCLPDYPGSSGYRGSGYDRSDAQGPFTSSGPPSTPDAPLGPPPEFGTTTYQTDAPPPLSGGTLAVAPDGFTVVAADPDRDRVYVVDYRDASTLRTVALQLHDEPGRVVVDASGRAHVALRSAGGVVTIDLATATVVRRIDVCSAPRGIAYDPATDLVHVACAGGELVALEAATGAEQRRRLVAEDLRDVVVVPGALVLTTFRDARILRLANGGDVAVEHELAQRVGFGRPRVAWRMVAAPPKKGGGLEVVVAQQKAPEIGDVVPPVPAQYYDSTPVVPTGCDANGPGPVVLDGNTPLHVPSAVLPVDVTANADWMVLVAAGNAHTPSLPQLIFVARPEAGDAFSCTLGYRPVFAPGMQLTSVAFASSGAAVVALSREPAALLVVDPVNGHQRTPIALAPESREDTGHAIFHSNSGAGVACASCHPDGRDDGHAWASKELGRRRTPSLLGTIANTAPYHWNGEAKDMPALLRLTFQSRMRGPELSDDRLDVLDTWLRALKEMPPAASQDPAAVSRGKALFEGAATCQGCHSGAMRTNNATVDVQTGGSFQVPSLVGVAWRAPLLHDGTAPSVKALLERAHGGQALQPQQILDLDAYVRTF